MITFYVPNDSAAASAATILADAAAHDPNFADTDFEVHVNADVPCAYAEGSDDYTIAALVSRINDQI